MANVTIPRCSVWCWYIYLHHNGWCLGFLCRSIFQHHTDPSWDISWHTYIRIRHGIITSRTDRVPATGALLRLLGFLALQEAQHFLLGLLQHAVGRQPPTLARDQSLRWNPNRGSHMENPWEKGGDKGGKMLGNAVDSTNLGMISRWSGDQKFLGSEATSNRSLILLQSVWQGVIIGPAFRKEWWTSLSTPSTPSTGFLVGGFSPPLWKIWLRQLGW